MSMIGDTPAPDASDETPRDEKLAELIEEVDEDPGTDGASDMSDRLRDKTEQSAAVEEQPGDLED
ncbi:hypothetical protein [Agreia sp.]|uniref:hypothetical protein n=1 Tax=Agreia sp. TaxID=1872416 RepID=UPI0035BBFE9E